MIIPDVDNLIKTVLSAAAFGHSHLHGEAHWKCVAWTGLKLAPEVPGCDPVLVFLFGLLHDSMRLHDGHDPQHGRRAGVFARSLNGNAFNLTAEKMSLLAFACDAHADGGTSAEPTVGLCWDADRLNLWRVGAKPSPGFMSTGPARRRDVIQEASKLEGQHVSWGKIWCEVELLLV
jgi:uncharacterized protein